MADRRISYGSLVSGRVNTKLTIYHKCILTEFEDICASGFRSRDLQLNALCKERRNGKLKGQLEKDRLPLLMSRTSLCLVPNTRCHFARIKTKKRNYKFLRASELTSISYRECVRSSHC